PRRLHGGVGGSVVVHGDPAVLLSLAQTVGEPGALRPGLADVGVEVQKIETRPDARAVPVAVRVVVAGEAEDLVEERRAPFVVAARRDDREHAALGPDRALPVLEPLIPLVPVASALDVVPAVHERQD